MRNRTLVTGKKAEKIKKGCELKDVIDNATKELKKIKKDLGYETPGIYYTKEGHVLDITAVDVYSDIHPKDALKALKKKRMGKKFPEVVKVQITKLKNFLSKNEIAEMRKKIREDLRWKWC